MAPQAPEITVNIPKGEEVNGNVGFTMKIQLKDNNLSLEKLFSESFDEVVNQILDDTVFESEEDKKVIDGFVEGLKQVYIKLLNEKDNKNSLKLFTTKPGQLLQDAGKRRRKMRGGELTNRQKVLAKMIAGISAFLFFYFRYFELINGLEQYKSETIPTLCTTQKVTELEQELMTPSLSFSSLVNKEGFLAGIRQQLATCGTRKEDYKFNLNSYQLQIQSTISFGVISIAFAIPTELLAFILAGMAQIALVTGQGNVTDVIKNLTTESQKPMRTLEEATESDIKKEKEKERQRKIEEIKGKMEEAKSQLELVKLEAELKKLQQDQSPSSTSTPSSNVVGTSSSTRQSRFASTNVMTIGEPSSTSGPQGRKGRASSPKQGGRRTKRHQIKRRMTKRR